MKKSIAEQTHIAIRLGIVVAVVAFCATAFADAPAAVDGNGSIVTLPDPPEAISALIQSGNVRFEFYDPKVVVRSFDGETEFEFRYEYKSRSAWKRKEVDGKPGIEVGIQYEEVKLAQSHRILLPDSLIGDGVFKRQLTLHEFDHVRISSDPRWGPLLQTMLKSRNSVMTKAFDEDEDEIKGRGTPQELNRITNQMVKEASDAVFNELIELVRIRYRELDRVSRYGLETMSKEDRQRIVEAAPKAEVAEKAE